MDLELVSALASAMGGGVQGFQQGYDKQLDRDQRSMELAAKLRAESRDIEFKNFERDWKNKELAQKERGMLRDDFKANARYDAATGTYQPLGLIDPKTQSEIDKNKAMSKYYERSGGKRSSGASGSFGEVIVPGYEQTENVKLTPPERKLARQAVGEAKTLTDLLRGVQAKLQGKKTTDLADLNFKKEIDQDLRDAQLLYKSDSFAKLGVLTGPDLAILEQVIENPYSLTGALTGPNKVAQRYTDAINRIEAGIANKLGAMGMKRSAGASGNMPMNGAPASGPQGPTIMQNGHIYNWNPKTGNYE